MKNRIPILGLFVLFTLGLQAQITITQTDMLQVGAKIVLKLDTTHPVLNYGGTGSGQSWDFSSIKESTRYNADVVTPAGNVKATLFPDANAVIVYFGFNVQYYKNTATELTHLGTVVTFLDTPVYYYNYNYIRYPAKMGDNFTDVGTSQLFLPIQVGIDPDQSGPHPFVDSIGSMVTNTIYSHIDAEGSVKTPEGTYNALRQYNQTSTTDSAYMYANGKWQPISALMSSLFMMPLVNLDTTHAYAWVAKNKNLPVANIEFDPATGEVLTAQWMQDGPVGLSSLETLTEIDIYPNPANDRLYINLPLKKALVEIIDLKGNRMHSGQLFEGTSEISVTGLKNGQYILLIRDETGMLLDQRQVQIQR